MLISPLFLQVYRRPQQTTFSDITLKALLQCARVPRKSSWIWTTQPKHCLARRDLSENSCKTSARSISRTFLKSCSQTATSLSKTLCEIQLLLLPMLWQQENPRANSRHCRAAAFLPVLVPWSLPIPEPHQQFRIHFHKQQAGHSLREWHHTQHAHVARQVSRKFYTSSFWFSFSRFVCSPSMFSVDILSISGTISAPSIAGQQQYQHSNSNSDSASNSQSATATATGRVGSFSLGSGSNALFTVKQGNNSLGFDAKFSLADKLTTAIVASRVSFCCTNHQHFAKLDFFLVQTGGKQFASRSGCWFRH